MNTYHKLIERVESKLIDRFVKICRSMIYLKHEEKKFYTNRFLSFSFFKDNIATA
jgi:hypothetical protein